MLTINATEIKDQKTVILHPTNKSTSTKYNIFTFLPLALFA